MLSCAQAAQRMACSETHVHTLIRLGRLKAINIGAGEKHARWRIPEEALVEFMRVGESGLLSSIQTR